MCLGKSISWWNQSIKLLWKAYDYGLTGVLLVHFDEGLR